MVLVVQNKLQTLPVTSTTTRRRDFYTRQIARLDEELAAVDSDITTAPNERIKSKLNKQAEQLLAEIDSIEQKLSELDSESSDQNVRDRSLEKILQKIDFLKAKSTASLIKGRLSQEGGSVLFFLQKSKKQMGHYCVEEVLSVLLGDQIIDGKVVGAYRRYSVDLDSAISQCNETEFLTRLASHLNVNTRLDEKDGYEELSRQLREKIKSSIDDGTTIFLEIRGVDELLEAGDFLPWFIQEFWTPLIDKVTEVSQKYKSKFIVALIADSHILSDCPPDYFCDDDSIDCYKLLELPLPNWSIDDIYDWLVRFRTLSAKVKQKTDAELQRVAQKVHRDSEGTPQNICANLRELFL
jgi:hypothetical protein